MPDNPEVLEPDAGLGFTDRVSACVRRNSRGTMSQTFDDVFRRPLALSALVILLLQVSGLIAGPMWDGCRATCRGADGLLQGCRASVGSVSHARSRETSPDRCRIGCDRATMCRFCSVCSRFSPAARRSAIRSSAAIRRSRHATLVVRTRSRTSPPPEARG